MGLHQSQSTYPHARISRQSVRQIQPQKTMKISPQSRSQEAIHRGRNSIPPLSKEDTTYIQAVAGTLLYHPRAVDPTILPALSAIATEQAKLTQETMKNVKQLLDYCSTQDEAIITYNASNMILAVHSDAGYANEKNHEAEQEVIFSYRMTTNFPQTTAQFSPLQQLLKR